jgi:tRNA A-37 threonylcarbamoyl transferase component Bud32
MISLGADLAHHLPQSDNDAICMVTILLFAPAQKKALVYLAKHGVNNVVRLVDDTVVDGRMWLIQQPLGEQLPDGPAELVVANTNALAGIIQDMAVAGMLHGDIAYSNIGYLAETKRPFFLDFGCARMLSQVRKGMPLASLTCLEHGTQSTAIFM